MFHTPEPLLFGCGNKLPITKQRSCRVAVEGIKAENDHLLAGSTGRRAFVDAAGQPARLVQNLKSITGAQVELGFTRFAGKLFAAFVRLLVRNDLRASRAMGNAGNQFDTDEVSPRMHPRTAELYLEF